MMDIYSLAPDTGNFSTGHPSRPMDGQIIETTQIKGVLTERNVQEPVVPYYTLKEVAEHCDFCSCWIVVHDGVYDITDFLNEHPGGWDVLLENAGTDATVVFDDKGHSKDARELLKQYKIGELVQEQRRGNIFKCPKT